jgi:Cytochrome c/c1 heme lyase
MYIHQSINLSIHISIFLSMYISFHVCVYRYSLPFDRHDWLIDRDGVEVRYVIDFYKGAATPSSATSASAPKPISIYLDVRPAVDSYTAVFDRIYVSVYETLFGAMKFHIPHSSGSIGSGGHGVAGGVSGASCPADVTDGKCKANKNK